jgi:nucleoside-diphosphate-sugar epimerase
VRVLVTGGAGFIGSHLTRRLVMKGHDVLVFDNLSTGHPSNLDRIDAELVEGDIREPAALASAMKGVEAVFHVAALPSVARSWEDPVTSLHTNALGTSNVVEAAIAAGAHTMVYSSSSSVYGDQEAERKSEDLPPHPISPYGHSKLLGEKLVLAHSQAGRIKGIALRYFNVFGPRQDPQSPYAAVIPLFIRHALERTVATINGDGCQSRDFTYIDNVVEGNLLALQGDVCGEAFNCACGQNHSLLELAQRVSELAGHPLDVVHGPPRTGDIRHSLADVSRIQNALGYRPRVDFDEGLRRTFEAYSRG